MKPLAPSYVSHLDFLRFVRRLHATIGPAVLNATFFYWKMSRIRRRFHGTIVPAILKPTFFVPPGCQNSIPGNISSAEVLAPCPSPPAETYEKVEGFPGFGGGPEPKCEKTSTDFKGFWGVPEPVSTYHVYHVCHVTICIICNRCICVAVAISDFLCGGTRSGAEM